MTRFAATAINLSELGPPDVVETLDFEASLAQIKAADYALTPGRYVGAAEAEADGEQIEEKLARLRGELDIQFAESARLAEVVREQLERVS